MKRNSITLFLQSPGAITPVPWVDNAPDFSQFSEPTLSVLVKAWDDFVASGELLEVIPDPVEVVEPSQPNWDGFNGYMLIDSLFKSYRDIVRPIDGDLNGALFDAYGLVSTNGFVAFSLVWGYWCQVSGITGDDRSVIANTAHFFNLPADFVAVIRG